MCPKPDMKSATRLPLNATVIVQDQLHLMWDVLRVNGWWKEPSRIRALAWPDSGACTLASETSGSRADAWTPWEAVRGEQHETRTQEPSQR